MKQKAFNTEVWRSITHSLGRFIAIFAIVALGVGFYAGLQMTAPDMKLAADAFYDETNLFDIRVVSTMGLSQENVDALAAVEGVEAAQPAYETDAEGEINGEPYTFRIHSLAGIGQVEAERAEARVNDLVVREGRLPEAEGECVVSADRIMNEPVQLGDKIVLLEGLMNLDDVLRRTEFMVVGLVSSSYYTSSTSMGTTSLGSGIIQQYLYIPENDFSPEYPISEVFITVEGARDLNGSGEEYGRTVDAVMNRIEEIASQQEQLRADELRNDAQAELDDARAEFEQARNDAYAQLDDAKAQLDSVANTIAASERELAIGQRSYDDGKAELARQRADAAAQMDAAQKQIDSGRAALVQTAKTLEQSAAQLDIAWASVAAQGITKENAPAVLTQLKAQLAMLSPEDPQYQYLAVQIGTLEQLIQNQTAYDQGLSQYQAGMKELDQAQAQLARQRAEAEEQMTAAQKELDDAAAELASGRSQLAQGRIDYQSGLTEYEQSRADAEAELADAEEELDQAQADIDAIETPDWLIMDRTKNYGAESFQMDADRVGNIAAVFPLIFFLVAALVALTTMTRMVDEERMLIGTYKALGYSRARITSKYLIYAATASIAGSIVGIAALAFTLPSIIMSAYGIVYIVPVQNLQLNWPIVLMASGLGVGITLVATAAAAISTLRESPAALMLPPAPKAGKRIFLERVRPLWHHLSFLWKVTCRNIFRYKKRLFMTIVGIAGCTALLLTGFGLQDSINDIIDRHYGSIVRYTVMVTEEEGTSQADHEEIQRAIATSGDADVFVATQREGMVAVGGGPGATEPNDESEDLTVEVYTPQNAELFEQLWTLRNRLTGETLQMQQEGAIITEKLAAENGIAVGDNIVIAERDDMGNATDTRYVIPVTGIAENYVGHSVFLSAEAYEQVFNRAPEYLTTFANISDDPAVRSAFTVDMQALDAVKMVAYNDETIDSYKTALQSVDMVVVVLICAAAALAFIVLYNLTNINITERVREIATLKVLGFTPREVQSYIFRETIVLSIMGALVGLVLGIFLENFVVVTAEVNQVMFGRDIHVMSFVLAFVLTMVFTVLVMLVMRRKLAHVDMVESLKSNE